MVPGKKVGATYKRFHCSSVHLFSCIPTLLVAAQLNLVLIRLVGLDWLESGGYFFRELSFSR